MYDKFSSRNYFLHGTYRKLIVIPKSFKWEFKTYKRLNDSLIESKNDRDKSEGTFNVEKCAFQDYF